MTWSIFFITSIILIYSSVYCLSDYTYSFTLSESSLDNVASYYSISVVIYVKYQSNGLAQFKTNVYNLSPLHFSMFVNGENCGLLSRVCVFNLQKGESIHIKIVKIDQESELLSFSYIDQKREPQINAGQCLVILPGSFISNCISASENHYSDGNKYLGNLCLCSGPVTSCTPITKNDSCISNEQWWNTDTTGTPHDLPTITMITESPTTPDTTVTSANTTQGMKTTMTTRLPGSSRTYQYTTQTTTDISPHPASTLHPTTHSSLSPDQTTTLTTASSPLTSQFIVTDSTSTMVPTPPSFSTTRHSEFSTGYATTNVPTRPMLTTTKTSQTTSHYPFTTSPQSSTGSTIVTGTTIHFTSKSHSITSTRSQTTISVPTTTTSIIPSTSQLSSTQTSSTMSVISTTFAPTEEPTLKNLSESIIGINNVSRILNETLIYSNLGTSLNSTQVYEISTILYNSANVPGLSSNDSVAILQNLDNILNVNEDTMYQSGSSSQQLLAMLPMMVHNTEDHRIDYLDGTNLGFTAKKIDCTNLDIDDGLLDLGFEFELINSTRQSREHKNSIVVPLTELCSTQDLTHVFFTIYRQSSLFVGQQKYNIYNGKSTPIGQKTKTRTKRDVTNVTQSSAPSACSRQTSVTDSPIMSATIMNNGVMLRSTNSEAIMAVVKFNISQIQTPLHGSFKVTWWDTGRSQWATDRQCTIVSEQNGIVTAQCLHLTDFAIIVDAALNDPNVCDTALIDLGYVVNSISIAALVFLSIYSISTYSRKLSNHRFFRIFESHTLVRRDFIVLVYHIDLLLFYFLFTVFSNQETSGSLCTTMAALMYALLLCSILLTIFQGIRNVLTFLTPKLFRIGNTLLSPPSVITLSIVIPFSISMLLLVFTNFFDRQDCFCWVRPDYVIFAIVVPITVLLLNTVFCTILIIYKVFFGMKRKFSSREGVHHYDPNVITKIVSIIVMQISLGMPWFLQFGTLYSPYTTFWHYLFTIVMGSQGTILLLIFVYKKYKIRAYESEQRSSSRQPQSIRKRAITSEEILESYD